MDKRKIIIRIIFGIAAIALITAGGVFAMNRGTEYMACEVTKGSIAGTVEESGKIHGKEDKIYFSDVTAPVKHLTIKEGDQVKKGDKILEYDTEDLERLLREAELKTEQSELEFSGRVSESDKYASKYNKAVRDDNSYAALYYIFREQGNALTEEQYARSYQIQCEIDSVNKEIAEKQREIAEKQHKKNKASGYGTKEADDYTEKNVKDIKDAQKEIDRLNEELCELNKGLYEGSYGNMTPEENASLNDTNNVMEDITRNWTEAKSNKAAYEGSILNEDEKEALKKNTELSKEEEDAVSSDLIKARKGVTAEFSGIVTSLDIHDGSRVSEGTPLFTIETSEELICRVNVSKFDILDIKEGQRAVIDIAGRRYEGNVTKIGKLATEDSSDKSRVEIEITLKNADEAAIIGLEGDATIYTEEKEDALIIPVEAFYSDDEGDYCYTVSNGVVEKRYITSGIRDGSKVEVLDGLSSGDIVITDAVTDADLGKKAKYVTD